MLLLQGEIDFDELKKMSYDESKKLLLKLPGIGDKVADCVMLFSLEKLEAFPLDTWILKILQKYYSNNFCIDKKIYQKRDMKISTNIFWIISESTLDILNNFSIKWKEI